MAGSYRHVTTDDGYFIGPERFYDLIENLGDAYEAIEEMYGMIWYLTRNAPDPAALIAEAERGWNANRGAA